MYSDEHVLYLKRVKKYNYFVRFMQIFIIISFVVLWQILADFNLINTFISSSPEKVFTTIVSLFNSGDLFYHIGVTYYEVLISFFIGTLLGLFIATILWKYKFMARVLDPYLTVLNSLPKVSLGPIIVIIFGAGTFSIVMMALFISIIITIMNVYQAFISTDVNKIKVMKSFKASDWQIFSKLILPSNFYNIINVFKINISLTFIGVIMGEFLVSKAGVGYLIMYGSQVFNLNLVITGIIILAIMASVMYYFVVFLEKVFK